MVGLPGEAQDGWLERTCEVDNFKARLEYMTRPIQEGNLTSKVGIRGIRVLPVYVSRDPATYIRHGRGQ